MNENLIRLARDSLMYAVKPFGVVPSDMKDFLENRVVRDKYARLVDIAKSLDQLLSSTKPPTSNEVVMAVVTSGYLDPMTWQEAKANLNVFREAYDRLSDEEKIQVIRDVLRLLGDALSTPARDVIIARGLDVIERLKATGDKSKAEVLRRFLMAIDDIYQDKTDPVRRAARDLAYLIPNLEDARLIAEAMLISSKYSPIARQHFGYAYNTVDKKLRETMFNLLRAS